MVELKVEELEERLMEKGREYMSHVIEHLLCPAKEPAEFVMNIKDTLSVA